MSITSFPKVKIKYTAANQGHDAIIAILMMVAGHKPFGLWISHPQ
ncbi:hypothetical protein [Shewanella sp. SNU WT4]|nr:hypothetical protein [Shewanella sp. SNU WT4]